MSILMFAVMKNMVPILTRLNPAKACALGMQKSLDNEDAQKTKLLIVFIQNCDSP